MTERDKDSGLPAWVAPQLATLATVPPDGDEWMHEIKLNGHRMLMRIESGKVRLLARNRHDWTGRLPALAAAAARLPVKRALLDGELVALDEAGVSRFSRLQEALEDEDEEGLEFVAFDVLHLDGEDLRPLPLEERKARLAERLSERRVGIGYSRHTDGGGREFYDHACEKGLEGTVSKQRAAPYRSGRSQAWLKVLCASRRPFVIGGFTEPEDPEGERSGVGSLLIGTYDRAGRLRYAGRVAGGLGHSSHADLRRRLQAIEDPAPPFGRPLAAAERHGVRWVRPVLVGDVAFSRWPHTGRVGDPWFLALRADLSAREVAWESEERAAAGRPEPAHR